MADKKRIWIDTGMTLLLFLVMAYHYTGQMWHEITGTGMFLLFLAHHLVNRKWYSSIGKGRYSAVRGLQTIIDMLLIVDVVLLMVSGIAMSNYVFRFLSLPMNTMVARTMHMIGAYAGFLLMSFHIGLHMGRFLGQIWRSGKHTLIFTCLFRILVIVVILYGAYALYKRNILGYISGSMMFAYFDYTELPILFFMDYAAIMGFMIVIAHIVKTVCKGEWRRNMRAIGNHIKKHRMRYIILAVIFVLAVVLFLVFGRTYIRRHFQTVSVNREQVTQTEKAGNSGKKGIIVYFTRVGNTDFEEDVDAVSSASLMEENGTLIGNSELLAEMIENATGFPTYAIKVKKKYSSSYGDTVREASEELKNNTPTEFTGELPELSEYEDIFLVYPLWWGTLPMPVQTFLNQTDLEGKTIYTLVTHGGSGFGTAIEDTKKFTKATVSEQNLSVYDDDVTKAAAWVSEWVKTVLFS